MKSLKLIYQVIVSLAVGGLVVLSGCSDDGAQGTAGEDGSISPFTRAEWVASITDWSEAEANPVVLTFGDDFSYAFTSTNSTVTASGSSVTLTAGQPYVMNLVSPAANTLAHYLSTKPNTDGTANMPGDFFKAIAVRKVQTVDAEYKAPYFRALEINNNSPGEIRQIQIYFVAVLPGGYYVYCQEGTHETSGMTGEITITGGDSNQLDLGVDPLFDTSLLNQPTGSTFGAGSDWGNGDITVTMAEGPYAFSIAAGGGGNTVATFDLMAAGTGYVVQLDEPAALDESHYFTAPEWFKSVWTRKAEDSQGEIKVPYFDAVELRGYADSTTSTSTALFVVPVFSPPGVGFDAYCTQPGHATATGGMRTNFTY